ncbi:hypothetical protein Golax_025866 [Gossypium laxum]|uniref:UBC core domain-containing protein n=1 Tax=Gossypium laxum TaxID=34288 RepID=A0A7J9B097_9ROSI|nr:hypothetical protein [Gossypium laxum]
MSDVIARSRLVEERKAWPKNHPHVSTFFSSLLTLFFNFCGDFERLWVKPETRADGSVDLMVWHCVIPGKKWTDWEGGYFLLTLNFCEEYPSKPSKCKFPNGFFHPNIYHSGIVCLSILSERRGWRPSIIVKQILVGIQDLLDQPNAIDTA